MFKQIHVVPKPGKTESFIFDVFNVFFDELGCKHKEYK